MCVLLKICNFLSTCAVMSLHYVHFCQNVFFLSLCAFLSKCFFSSSKCAVLLKMCEFGQNYIFWQNRCFLWKGYFVQKCVFVKMTILGYFLLHWVMSKCMFFFIKMYVFLSKSAVFVKMGIFVKTYVFRWVFCRNIYFCHYVRFCQNVFVSSEWAILVKMYGFGQIYICWAKRFFLWKCYFVQMCVFVKWQLCAIFCDIVQFCAALCDFDKKCIFRLIVPKCGPSYSCSS